MEAFYGLEPDENEKSLQDYIGALNRRKFLFIIPFILISIVTVIVALLWPAVYRSTATIMIEQQEIPREFVRSTITGYAAQQVQVISQRILTVENIGGIVEKFGLYQESKSDRRAPATKLAGFFRENMDLDMVSAQVRGPGGRSTQATIAFTLSFDGPVPGVTQQVVNELVTLFLNENLRNRTNQAAVTEKFLAGEAESLGKELTSLETAIAEFKKANEGSLPELYQFNLSTLDRTQKELFDITYRVQELDSRKIQLNAELLEISPSSQIRLPTGEVLLNYKDRLRLLETEYQIASSTYTEKHPEVLRIKREMEAINEATSVGSNQDEIQDGQSDSQGSKNPTYVLLTTQLRAIDAEVQSLEHKKQALRTKMEQFEALLSNAPYVERDYQALLRDYAAAQVRYQDIRAKQREAKIAENLEQEQKGERFILIEPPAVPVDPISPNRPGIVMLGLIFGGALGVGLIIIREMMDNSIHSEREFAMIMGENPIAVIPYIGSEADTLKQKKLFQVAIAGVAAFIILATLYIHFFFRPLDVLWFVILKKLGLS